MDLERLPYGKFETNGLVLELAVLAYNILRMFGQESISRRVIATKHDEPIQLGIGIIKQPVSQI